MKNTLKTLLAFCAISLLSMTNTAAAAPDVQKLVGTFQSSRGERFIVSKRGNEVTLRTNAELSKYGLCSAPVVLKTIALSSSEGYARSVCVERPRTRRESRNEITNAPSRFSQPVIS